jgi:HD-GYP domain-containing protein (c-di-GMP phosphodiesterase class II)/putative methionine-R-sulfoxide reductase with GAF domain
MTKQSADDLNALSSGILGVIGMSFLLIPGHFQTILMGLPSFLSVVLGGFCFISALLCQVLFTIQIPDRRKNLIRGPAMVLLLLLGGLFTRAGFFVEAMLLIIIGLAQGTPILKNANENTSSADGLKITSILANIGGGIYFLLISTFHIQSYTRLMPYQLQMAGVFLFSAGIGIYSSYRPLSKLSPLLTRLTALPWLAWCLFFFTDRSVPILAGPAFFTAVILLAGVFPWQNLTLPETDILGRRVVTVGAAVEIMTLVFLTALLALTDSINPTLYAAISVREAAFVFYLLISVVMYYGIATTLMTINGLMAELTGTKETTNTIRDLDFKLISWNERLARYLRPFALTRDGLRSRANAQADQITSLSRQVSIEKRRNAQLNLLAELSQQLEHQLDQPVAAQLAVNTLDRAINCSLVCLYTHEPDHREFLLLAAAGHQTNLIPPGYRQNMSAGLIGRAVRQRKTQIVNDTRKDPDYIFFENEKSLSAIAIPIIFNGHVNGAIVCCSDKASAFDSVDVALAEAVSAELSRAWERSGYHQRLMELIQSGSLLSAMVEPESTAQEIASIAKQILQARFTYVQIRLGQEEDFVQSASSGHAPRLLASLVKEDEANYLVHAAFHAAKPFRVRDVRKYSSAPHLDIDQNSLRSMLAIPIRWHRLSIGAILAFGKQNEVFFTENDESLAELLSIQAAGAFESTWLQQELRASLRTTSLLYRLSNQIIQAEELRSAALDIAQTAHKLGKGSSTGIVLFTIDGKIEAELEVDENGTHNGTNHPMDTIRQVMNSGQLIYFSQGHAMTRVCLPIQTSIRKYGALWINIREDQTHKPANPADLQTLVNQAAIALERSILLVESRRQAREIKAAYDTLEATYDQTLAALMTALDERDRETEGHSQRVSQLAGKLGEAFGLTHPELKALERGSLLHDIGKIGISDTILHKPGQLDDNEWKIMRLHPDIGARIVEGIPFLQETLPVIRYHQERWDGSGYPIGLSGERIPLLARLFAVVDAFDALTSNRPYRQKVSAEEALRFLRKEAGILFDPKVVAAFEELVLQGQAADLLATG